MPIRNLGPCACCVSRYPVKVVATDFWSSYFTGDIVDGVMVNYITTKVDRLCYTIYYSDGLTSSYTYEGEVYYNDPHWTFDVAEHTATYSLPVSATDANENVYNAVIALTWDADALPHYSSSTDFYDSLRLNNAANETFEFVFERSGE